MHQTSDAASRVQHTVLCLRVSALPSSVVLHCLRLTSACSLLPHPFLAAMRAAATRQCATRCRGGTAASPCSSLLWHSRSTRRERRSGRRCEQCAWLRVGLEAVTLACGVFAPIILLVLLPVLLWLRVLHCAVAAACASCWCGWHGLTVLPCPHASHPMQPRANHVWMAGVGSAADEAEVLRCCREGAIPPPEHLLKVRAATNLDQRMVGTCNIGCTALLSPGLAAGTGCRSSCMRNQ